MEDEREEKIAEERAAEGGAELSAEGPAAPEGPEWGGFLGKVDRYFGITKSGSTFRKEIVAGLTTFMAMIYIFMVNAGMFSEEWVGISYGAAYIATGIGAVTGTMLMAFLANMPLAQASGMGINAFLVYTLLTKYKGLTYANCMAFTLIDGVIFIILTVTGLRKRIFGAVPQAVRKAIPIGIGLFVAFVGLQQAKIIVSGGSTLVQFFSLNVLPGTGNVFMGWDAKGGVTGMLPGIVALCGVIAIAVMTKKKVKGAILWGLLGSTALFYVLAGIAYGCGSTGAANFFGSITLESPFKAFGDWGREAFGKVFTEGFDFGGVEGGVATVILVIVTSAMSLCMIDLFDTIGALYGACARGNLLEKDGTPIRMNRMMLSDAIATCVGATAGTSTITTFVESSSGVAAGGKTGFTALTTGVLFLIVMFLSPVTQLIPRSATAAALIWVGVLMMAPIREIDWSDASEAIVSFLTFIVMLLGYSIAKGIGVGILAFVLIKLCTGKVREISAATWVIGVLFLAMFLLT